VSASVTGLSANTTYHFRIVAKNVAGPKVEGKDLTFKTLPAASPPTVEPQLGPGILGTLPAQGVLPFQERKAPPVPDAELANTSLTVSPGGVITITVTCPGGESSCTGTVTLRTLNAVLASASGHQSRKRKAAILTLAIGSFTLGGGQAKALTLHLSAKARTLLSRAHLLRVRATILAHDPAGATHTTQTIVTLRATRAKR
jgi:hypothetical protein